MFLLYTIKIIRMQEQENTNNQPSEQNSAVSETTTSKSTDKAKKAVAEAKELLEKTQKDYQSELDKLRAELQKKEQENLQQEQLLNELSSSVEKLTRQQEEKITTFVPSQPLPEVPKRDFMELSDEEVIGNILFNKNIIIG